MQISCEDLREIARNFLSVLERERIIKTKDLEINSSRRLYVDNSKDFVMISVRGKREYQLSYNCGMGQFLRVNINNKNGFSQIVVRGCKRIEDYTPLNPFVQHRIIETSIISRVKAELKRLV